MGFPSRLSDQQKFILAALRDGDIDWSYLSPLSWDVAEEFDKTPETDGRVFDPEEHKQTPEELVAEAFEMFDDSAKARKFAQLSSQLSELGPDSPVLNRTHRASFSRSLKRLEERGLVDRRKLKYTRTDGWVQVLRNQHTHALLTDEGKEAADEIRRRVSDGRYSLSFDTLTVDTTHE